jgi:hypothetical protein
LNYFQNPIEKSLIDVTSITLTYKCTADPCLVYYHLFASWFRSLIHYDRTGIKYMTTSVSQRFAILCNTYIQMHGRSLSLLCRCISITSVGAKLHACGQDYALDGNATHERSTKYMHKTKQEAIAHVQIILNINQRNINAMTKVSSIISMNYLCLRYIMSYFYMQLTVINISEASCAGSPCRNNGTCLLS